MYGQAGAQGVAMESEQPVTATLAKTFDYNLERMHKCFNGFEDKLHSILNLRQPTPPDAKAGSIPMEDDFTKALNNRLNQFALLDDRLEKIVG